MHSSCKYIWYLFLVLRYSWNPSLKFLTSERCYQFSNPFSRIELPSLISILINRANSQSLYLDEYPRPLELFETADGPERQAGLKTASCIRVRSRSQVIPFLLRTTISHWSNFSWSHRVSPDFLVHQIVPFCRFTTLVLLFCCILLTAETNLWPMVGIR